MNTTPGASPEYAIFTTGISCGARREADMPLTLGTLSEMSGGGWLDDLVARITAMETQTGIWLFIDEPDRPLSRIMAALAAARVLAGSGKTVVVLDGDDQKAHLSTWAGSLHDEGWIDIARYGMSVPAASQVLPFGDGRARLVTVGSYKPTRLESGEAADLMARLGEHADHILIVASSGDRGLIWSGLESYNILCRSERDIGSSRTSDLIQDLQTINLSPHQLVVFESDKEAPAAIVEKYEFHNRRSSSAIFRVVAIAMAALLIGLFIWWVSLWLGNDTAPVTTLPAVDETTVGLPASDVPGDTAPVDTMQVAAEEPADETDDVYADEDPFNQPVGEAGYCLHVFSLVDSMLAEQQLDEMAARGVSGLIHSSVVDGRIWYRVYTGSFASVAECRAAMPEIFERLEIDWAMPASSRRIAQQ